MNRSNRTELPEYPGLPGLPEPPKLRGRTQIESWLGRRLTPDECQPAPSLAELSDAARRVVADLVRKQRVICISYLLAVVPSATARDILLFLHRHYP
jgi:hypothetical protein